LKVLVSAARRPSGWRRASFLYIEGAGERRGAEYLYDAGASDWQALLTAIASTLAVCGGATFVATKRLRRVDLASELRET
jgi:hypothetical protein